MIVVHVWIKAPGEKLRKFPYHGPTMQEIRTDLYAMKDYLPVGARVRVRTPPRRHQQRN